MLAFRGITIKSTQRIQSEFDASWGEIVFEMSLVNPESARIASGSRSLESQEDSKSAIKFSREVDDTKNAEKYLAAMSTQCRLKNDVR